MDQALWKKALQLHRRAIVIDTHCDTPMKMLERQLDIGNTSASSDISLLKMKDGGIDAAFFAAFLPHEMETQYPAKKALQMIDEIHRQVERYPALAQMAFSANDIIKIHRSQRRAILVGIENGIALEGDLRLLRTFYRLGVRYLTLTHRENNLLADSCSAKQPRWNGISAFGKRVVQEMNRLGMIIDVSHLSDKAFYDVLDLSSAPVIASHSSVRALCDIPRNMSDDMIKALAKNGGVIQISLVAGFLDKQFHQKSDASHKMLASELAKLKEHYKDNVMTYTLAQIDLSRRHAPPSPKIENLIDHIQYVVNLVGVDHVGLGSDYDSAAGYPEGLQDARGFPLITYHLLKRGYREADIMKILGGNLLRVLKQVQKATRHSSSIEHLSQSKQ